MVKDIQLIITGGTIDKEWDPFIELSPPRVKSKVTLRSKSGLRPYIEKIILPDYNVFEDVVSLVDSSDITDQIRMDIVNSIKNSKSENIIISHGTDSLAEFAKWLKKQMSAEKNFRKKVICLGGFYPLVGGVPSDAPFNLGYAIGIMEYIKPGIYVAMNSRLFNPDKVKKDFENSKFVTE